MYKPYAFLAQEEHREQLVHKMLLLTAGALHYSYASLTYRYTQRTSHVFRSITLVPTSCIACLSSLESECAQLELCHCLMLTRVQKISGRNNCQCSYIYPRRARQCGSSACSDCRSAISNSRCNRALSREPSLHPLTQAAPINSSLSIQILGPFRCGFFLDASAYTNLAHYRWP